MNRNILCVLSLLVFLPLAAQQELPGNIPTPNAASLGRYGDIPMSYYTGNPDISIPLYTMNVKGVELPIRLDYDASGVLINSLPGWTGHNWTLQAGGVITRTVRGMPDERIDRISPTSQEQWRLRNYFDHYGDINEFLSEGGDYNMWRDTLANHFYDMEPDIFTFSFMGHTGKFFLGNDGQWKVQSAENMDVLFDVSEYRNHLVDPFISRYPKSDILEGMPKVIEGFRIRDGKGNVYTFGCNANAIEYTTDFFKMTSGEDYESWTAVSWYLTNVSDRFGNTLYQLHYKRWYFMPQFYYAGEFTGVTEHGGNGYGGVGGSGELVNNLSFPFGGQLSSPVLLDSICGINGVRASFNVIPDAINPTTSFAGFKKSENGALFSLLRNHTNYNSIQGLPFFYLQTRREDVRRYQYLPYNSDSIHIFARTCLAKLTSVSIRSIHSGGLQLSFSLGYTKNPSFTRPRLTSVIKTTGNKTMKYTLQYFDFDSIPPDYLSAASDHWGYYNARGFDYQNLSSYNWSSFSTIRNPNAQTMLYGTLSKIIYPTGGCSMIEYEPHDFSKCLSIDHSALDDSVGIGGGLRVKCIKEYEDTACSNMLQSRTFTYSIPNSGVSSGQIYAHPVYYWPEWDATANTTSQNACVRYTTFRTGSIIPLSNTFGPNVGYSHVRETFADGSYTDYRYSSLSDTPMDFRIVTNRLSNNTRTPYDKFCEREFRLGKTLSSIHFNSSGRKQHSIGYYYRSDNADTFCTYSSSIKGADGNYSAAFFHFLGRVYKLYYPKYDVVERTDTTFLSNGTVSVEKTSFVKSDLRLNITWPYAHQTDVRVTNTETLSKNNLSSGRTATFPYESGDSVTRSLSLTDFDLAPYAITLSRNATRVMTENTNFQSIVINGRVHALAESLTRFFPAGGRDTLVRFLDYDNSGNLTRYIKQGEPYTRLVWLHNGTYLAAKILGDSGFNWPNNISLFNEDGISQLKSRQAWGTGKVTVFLYHPLFGVSTIIRPNGVGTHYHYNSFGQLADILDDQLKNMQFFDYNYRYY